MNKKNVVSIGLSVLLLGGWLSYYLVRNTVWWYRLAAEQGHADAQYNLGVCYDNGQGIAEDDAEAVKWFRKAAEQGHAKAQYNLGWCYYNGQGVAEDDAEAVKWFRKAAEQGHEQSGRVLEGFRQQAPAQ